GLEGDIGLVELLALPGVMEAARTETAPPEMRDLALQALAIAIRAMGAMREAEGEATAADLRGRLAALAALRDRIAERSATAPAAAKRKLEERLSRLGVDPAVDPARLAQEVAYLADRS